MLTVSQTESCHSFYKVLIISAIKLCANKTESGKSLSEPSTEATIKITMTTDDLCQMYASLTSVLE